MFKAQKSAWLMYVCIRLKYESSIYRGNLENSLIWQDFFGQQCWTLCSFFWVIPWHLSFMCRYFGTLCSETSAHKIQMPCNPKRKNTKFTTGLNMPWKKVLIDGELNSIVFVWRVTSCYTFLVNVTTSLLFPFTVLNILLSCNWGNLVFSVLFGTMEVGDLPDTFTYHAGMLHIVIMENTDFGFLWWLHEIEGSVKSGKWNMCSKNVDCHVRRYWYII